MENTIYIQKSWDLLKDAMNPENSYGIRLATDDLIGRIVGNEMNTIEHYMNFKKSWYSQLKNKSFK